MKKTISEAKKIFAAHNGILRTSEAINYGISLRTLYEMRDTGLVDQLSRGLYQLSNADLLTEPDLITVAKRIPKAVICLISALDYYGLTTQIPHQVYIALPQSAEKPRLDFPPLEIVWLSDHIYQAGIEVKRLDGIEVKMYSLEKTIADCFKFRNKVGFDVAAEALRNYLELSDRNIDLLMDYARINRVNKRISHYLEVLL